MGIAIILFFLIILFVLIITMKKNIVIISQINQRKIELTKLQEKINHYNNQIKNFSDQITVLETKRNQLANTYFQTKQSISESKQAFNSYIKTLDDFYVQKEDEITFQIDQLLNQKQAIENQKIQAQTQLDQIKLSVQAAAAARLVQQEKQDKWRFYSIHLTDYQINDIAYLQEWKNKLHDPSIVSKIIWSSYYIKPVGDMCNRVLGTQKKSGIYKLTNKATGQIYIGQSVDVANRFKTHIKYGLGIDTPITPNKLYQSMQNSSLWFWTFELLEECPKEKLNEREKFWIDFYQSNKIGLNTQGGKKS